MTENEQKEILHKNGIAMVGGRLQPAALLKVSGPDALEFLQGQFTQELRPGRADDVMYGLWLNQKGRVLADSHVLRVGVDEWWVFSSESPSDLIRERLEAYLIADEVVIEDLAAAFSGALLVGDSGRKWLEQAGASPPPPGALVRCGNGVAFAGRRGAPEMWEVILPTEYLVAAGWPEASVLALERARIGSGIPAVPRDIGPNDLPQEAGLDQVAVSYTKGCYLGQEVMARLNAMGRVRRRLLRVGGTGETVPGAGARLEQGDKTVGELRSAVDDGEGGWIGLAMFSLVNFNPSVPVSCASAGGPIKVLAEPLASP